MITIVHRIVVWTWWVMSGYKKQLTPTSNLKIIAIPHPAETPNPWVRQGTGMWRTSRSVLHLPPASDVQMTTSERRVFSAIVFRIPLRSPVYVPPLYPFLGTKKTRTKQAQLQRIAVFCNGRWYALWECKRKYLENGIAWFDYSATRVSQPPVCPLMCSGPAKSWY